MAAVVGSQGDLSLEPAVEPAIDPAAHHESPASGEAAVAAMESARATEAIGSFRSESPLPLGPSGAEDAAITAQVTANLTDLGQRVQVVTRGGVVILSGVVDTELEKSQALRIARSTKGVARVEDRLIVLVS